MRKEDFDEWLESDVTRTVFKYWDDLAKAEAQRLAERILLGVMLTDVEQTRIAVTYETLLEVQEILFDEFESFYNGDNDEGTRQ